MTQVQGVDSAGLRSWLESRSLLTETDPPLELTQLTGGSSNLTVRVQSGDHDWVLRRPPLRGALPTANDMLREYRLQAALASAGAELPLATMVDSCDDLEVIGAPFYVMKRLTGIIHNSASLAVLSDHDVHEVGLALVDALAQLHSVDPATVPAMTEFLRPEPYADRQLRRWSGQWKRSQEASNLAEEPVLDRVFTRLAAAKPPVPPARVVHGDFGLANVMFDGAQPTRVQAVLDWELAAVGDPLADLGALVAYQSSAGRLMNVGRADPVCHPDLQPALPSVAQLAERYATRSGESVEALPWYVSLAEARLAVIVAGALARLDPADPAVAARRTRTIGLIHDLAVSAESNLGQTAAP